MRPPQHNAIASPMPHECKCYVFVVGLKAEIQALKDQLAAGSPITQEQLDAVVLGLGEIETAVGARLAEAEEAAV